MFAQLPGGVSSDFRGVAGGPGAGVLLHHCAPAPRGPLAVPPRGG